MRYCDGSSTEGGIVGSVVGERLSLSLEERGVEEGEGDEAGLAIHQDGKGKRDFVGTLLPPNMKAGKQRPGCFMDDCFSYWGQAA